MKNEILVIDDNSDIRFLICKILKENDYLVREAANYDQAIFEIKKKIPDLAIIDIKLDKGDKDGIDLLKVVIKKNKSTPVIMISGHANVQTAVESIRLGAYEFLEKPFSTEKILNYVSRAIESMVLKKEKENLENKLFHSFDFIGQSPAIIKIKKIIEKLTNVESRVLITGNTGTGKELVARKIHKLSSRSKKQFIVLNCALLQPHKYEKELFGEELSDGTISYGILEILVSNGTFREDLFHRINVVPIFIPDLNSRTEDIPVLINYFQKKISEINGVPEISIDTKNDLLFTYNWPGNIRELRNLIERVRILSVNETKKDSNMILKEILTLSPMSKENKLKDSMSFPLKEAREQFEKAYLTNQLKKNHGNISKTADFIGMERSALHRKLKILGVIGIN